MTKKILIVEDDPLLLKMYHDKFAKEGFGVEDALNGEEGLEAAIGEHPDLILLDINMPKMDGLTMMGKLREDKWGHSVPIILITNLDANDERMKAVTRDEPAFYLLKKDYTLEDLLSKVREVLARD